MIDSLQSQDFVDTEKCYKASAYSSTKAGEPAIAVLSTDYQANDGKVKIFTVKTRQNGDDLQPSTWSTF